MKKWIAAAALAALLAISPAASAQEIIVDGMGADMSSAVKDASRNAVEQITGAMVESRTQVQDGAVDTDRIRTRSQGYVKTIQILSQDYRGGVLHVRAKIDVETDPKKLSGLKLGHHPTVGVYPFQNKGIVSKEWSDADMDLVNDYVYASLSDADLFTLVSRTDGKPLLDERAISQGKDIDPSTEFHPYWLKGAQYILVGNILGGTARTSKTSVVGAGANQYKVTATVSMRLVDTETSEVVLTAIGRGTAKNTVVKAPFNIIRIGTAELDDQQVLDALHEAVDDAVTGPHGLQAKMQKQAGKH